MARPCTICNHDEVEAINAEILNGTPLRTIADRWSVSKTALIRHNKDHIPEHLAKAQEVEEVVKADALLSEIDLMRTKVIKIMDETDRVRDWGTCLKAHKELRSYLELFAKLEGRLQSNQVNILVQPVWIEVRAVIMNALKPYPQAAAAVVEALKGVT